MVELENSIVFIPNTIDPYGYELVNILAYPAGFTYRFRFKDDWVQQKVQIRISELKDMPGYILLRDWSTGKLYPIRKSIVKNASKIGNIYYFEYELGAIIDYDSNETLRSNQIDQFNKEFLQFHTGDALYNPPNGHMKPLVLLSNYEPIIENKHYSGTHFEREFEQWGNVLSSIQNIAFFEDVEFIKLLDVANMSKEDDKAVYNGDAIFLTEGKDYRLRILQKIQQLSKEKPYSKPRDVELIVDNNYISPIRTAQRAVGEYDVLSFIIRTNPRSGHRRSFIDIKHVVKFASDYSIEPKLHIPVVIEKSYNWLAVKLVLIILFGLIYIIPSVLTYIIKVEERTIIDISIIALSVALFEFIGEIKSFLKNR